MYLHEVNSVSKTPPLWVRSGRSFMLRSFPYHVMKQLRADLKINEALGKRIWKAPKISYVVCNEKRWFALHQVYKHQGAENAQYGLEAIFKPPCSFPFVILTNLESSGLCRWSSAIFGVQQKHFLTSRTRSKAGSHSKVLGLSSETFGNLRN